MMSHFPVLKKASAVLCESDYLKMTSLDEKTILELTGFACAKEILNYYGPFYTDHIVVFAGPGRNGGDAITTALFLAPHTKKISIYVPVQPSKEILLNNLIRAKKYYSNIEFVTAPVVGDIYIDGLFGVELSGNLDDIFEQIIKLLNQQSNPVISIDVPSGIDADSAVKMGEVVNPDLTIAIGCLKPIHLQDKSEIMCGKIISVDIGVPHKFMEKYAEIQKVA